MPLYDRAENTLDLLDLDGLGQRPLAFVCHSLGGLLIKQALRNALDAPNPRWQAIARQTRLIVFLSTPHSGASLANWIQYLGKLLRTTVSVEELEAHHPRLRELNTWYRNHVGALGIETFVYYEKLPTAGLLVVDATTADPGIPGVSPIPVDEDHRAICKPASKEAQIYRRVQRLLEETVLREGVRPPPLGRPAAVISMPTRRVNGLRHEDEQLLKLIDKQQHGGRPRPACEAQCGQRRQVATGTESTRDVASAQAMMCYRPLSWGRSSTSSSVP